ncbi:MAG: 50S ribosomal protein L6, partial [Phycisphaerae bacterium]|nr:50S ribosomal protein L6 [Phycisphaerae bacterium]
MSRIGKKPISITAGVTVTLNDRTVSVEGPKGKLSWTHRPEVAVEIDDAAKVVTVTRRSEDRFSRSLHGLTRSLIANMIEGCAKGYVKGLEIYGVGYGVQLQGDKVTVNCGF